MKKTFRRIRPILVIGISVLVILICGAGVVGIWVVEGAASSAAAQMLQAVDSVAQGMRDGISSIDTSLATLGESVSSVEAVFAQLSQNVSDKGLLLTLLPTTKQEELAAASQSVRDDFAAIRDFLNATQLMVQAIKNLPFIDLPSNGLASIETFQERMVRMAALVEDLKAGVSEFRSQAAANVSKISETTANLGSLLVELRADFAQVDAELNTIQVQARQLQKLLPIILLSSAITVTLVAIWIAYSQVMIINRAFRYLRDLGSSQSAIELGEEPEGTVQPEISHPPEEKTEVDGSTQIKADESRPENREQNNSIQS